MNKTLNLLLLMIFIIVGLVVPNYIVIMLVGVKIWTYIVIVGVGLTVYSGINNV